ncbi:MAG: hypothetical protein BWY77_01751 [bacterium ADurb.Bin431]|nr:MAG: hypothetical protein BWY77_01751 [bacterium ADurb.Bin431]
MAESGVLGEGFQIEIGLVKAVEKDQGIRACVIEPLGHRCSRAEKGAQLHGNRDLDAALDGLEDVDVDLFNLGAGADRIGGKHVDVELESISARLLHLAGIVDPATSGDPVEAGDNRDSGRLLGLADVLKIALRPKPILLRLGKIGQRLGKTVGAKAEEMIQLLGLERDLLFEKGIENDRRCPGILEILDGIQILGEGGGRRNQRVLELQAHIGGC